jgi:ribosomal protein L21
MTSILMEEYLNHYLINLEMLATCVFRVGTGQSYDIGTQVFQSTMIRSSIQNYGKEQKVKIPQEERQGTCQARAGNHIYSSGKKGVSDIHQLPQLIVVAR